LVLCGLVLTGCKTGRLGPYIAPQVTGRVFAADTREALADVKVTRGGEKAPPGGSQPKGGELLMRKAPVRTDQNGRFTLVSERVLSVFRGSGWDQVRLTFERAGYEGWRTNYSTLGATNGPGSEPVLDVGEILLQPAQK